MNIVVGIIPVIIAFLIVFVCVRTIRQALSAVSKQTGAAKCGKCSYEIADLSFDRCPECGGLLLEVGIVTPALTARRGSSVVGLVATWTALIATGVITSLSVVGWIWSMRDANLPRGANSRINYTHTFKPDNWQPNPDYEVAINPNVKTGRDGKVRSGTIDVIVTNSSQTTFSLQMDAVTQEIISIDDSPLAPSEQQVFSHDSVRRLYEAAGLDMDDDATMYQSRQVLKSVGWIRNRPYTAPTPASDRDFSDRTFEEMINAEEYLELRLRGSGGSWFSAPPPTVIFGLNRDHLTFLFGGGFWLIVYIVGLRLMLLGRKRSLAQTA